MVTNLTNARAILETYKGYGYTSIKYPAPLCTRMRAETIDRVTRKGKYPNGLTLVQVRARRKEKYGGDYTWTLGVPTGETGQYDEHFEVKTESPLIENDKTFYHKEDIKEPDQ